MHVYVLMFNSLGSQAYCNQCNFNTSLSCHVVLASSNSQVGSSVQTPTDEALCKTEPVLIYSGLQLSHKGNYLIKSAGNVFGEKKWTKYIIPF